MTVNVEVSAAIATIPPTFAPRRAFRQSRFRAIHVSSKCVPAVCLEQVAAEIQRAVEHAQDI